MKRSTLVKFLAMSGVYLLAGVPAAATAQTSTAVSGAAIAGSETAPLPAKSPVSEKLISGFGVFAGSEENAASLVSGLRSGSSITVTNANGEVVRSSHWSGAGSSQARVNANTALSARSGGAQTLPAASTPTASGFGLGVAANCGGFSAGSHGNGR